MRAPEQAGKSDGGPLRRRVADLDASVGPRRRRARAAGIAENTLVLVTSDNGPWYQGRAAGLRGRKNETFEGGMRVPFIAWWPGRIPAGPAHRRPGRVGIDVLPTALALAGVPLPRDRDDRRHRPLRRCSRRSTVPERPMLYYCDRELQALRARALEAARAPRRLRRGTWSLALAPLIPQGPWLFDLERDPDEAYDVREKRRDDFAHLDARRAAWEREQAENPRGWR